MNHTNPTPTLYHVTNIGDMEPAEDGLWIAVEDYRSLETRLATSEQARREAISAEHKLSDAYLRLRTNIPGALDTPHAPTAEQVWTTTEAALTALREEVERVKAGARDTAEANHAATAHAKADDIAAYFIDTILKTQWDKDHMTRVLEGWLTKHLRASLAAADGMAEAFKQARDEVYQEESGWYYANPDSLRNGETPEDRAEAVVKKYDAAQQRISKSL